MHGLISLWLNFYGIQNFFARLVRKFCGRKLCRIDRWKRNGCSNNLTEIETTRLPDYHQHIGRECVCQQGAFKPLLRRLLPLSTRSALIIGFKLGNRTEWIKRVLVNKTFSLTWFLIHDLSGYVVTTNFNLGLTNCLCQPHQSLPYDELGYFPGTT